MPHRPSIPEQMLGYDAVALFVDHARRIRPDFELTIHNAPSVVEICRRLDGLPLAIELAAARIRVLSPAHILARLDARLPLLTAGSGARTPRQQTLRATIAWSYDLLTDTEQTLFRHLAVFSGGWSLDAATAVAGRSVDADLDILDGVQALVEKSLVSVDTDAADEPRFRLLETIREYGLEQLSIRGEQDAVFGRHADYYIDLAECACAQMRAAPHVDAFLVIDQEHDNLRAVLRWLEQQR